MVPPIGTPPTCVISSPANNALLAIPSSSSGDIAIAVSAGSSTGLINKVELYIDGVLFGTATNFPYSFSWHPTVVGTYHMVALAYDDKSNVVASSVAPASTTLTVAASPTVTVIAPVAGSTVGVGTPTTLTAAADDSNVGGGGIATVQFFVNGTYVGDGASAGGNQYSFSWTPTAAGTPSITALAINHLGLSTTSAAVSVTVTAGGGGGSGVIGIPPTVSISMPAAGTQLPVNRPTFITATAADPDGNVVSVQFFVNGQNLSTTSTYPYSATWTPTNLGTYKITAKVTDNDGNAVTSAPVSVTVIDPATTLPSVSITAPAAGSINVNTPQTISAAASSSSGVIAGVEFFVNGASIGTDTTFPYKAAWTPVALGTYSLTATATDNFGKKSTSAAVVLTVVTSTPPTVSITNPASNSTYGVGTPLTITAAAAASAGTIASVQFFVNGFALSTSTASPYSVQWTPVSTGSYTLTAVATDNTGNVTTSAAVPVNIAGSTLPTVTLTNPSAATKISAGTSITLTANAFSFSSRIVSVRFLASGYLIGSAAAVPPYTYTLSWTPTAAGTYNIVAEATDAAGNVATATPVVVTVASNQPPVATLTAPANSSILRVTNAVTLSATASDTDGTVSQVQFFANGTAVGSTGAVTSSGYTVSWTPTTQGVYRLTAVATDNAGGTGTSSTVYVQVVGAALNSADTVYTGSYQGVGESGGFALINLHGTGATFIGYSTTTPAKTYYYSDLTVDAGGGFALLDSSGRTLIRGSISDTGVNGSINSGTSTSTFIGPITQTGSSPVAAGCYTGNISGHYASILTAIVGSDASITTYVTDGSFSDAGHGTLTTTGSFSVTTTTGTRLVGKIDPATGFLTGTISGGTSGSLLAANGSGVTFSDGVLKSLSTRGQAGTGDNMLIAGFIVGGTTAKNILIRAVGPTLSAAPFNVSGALADPQFSIIPLGGSVAIAGNDNWGGTAALQAAFTQVYAFALPTNSNDAAAIVNLSPGGYTVQVSSVTGATGVALVELYDLDAVDPFTAQKLTGVSTRGLVGAGDNVLIAGVNVNGSLPKKVLVRAVGPTLAGFGVGNALSDPILTIKSGNTIVRENDNWESGNDPALVAEATTKLGIYALPSGSKDAVILMTLPPGLYSAVVSGANGATGIALVEVYEVP